MESSRRHSCRITYPTRVLIREKRRPEVLEFSFPMYNDGAKRMSSSKLHARHLEQKLNNLPEETIEAKDNHIETEVSFANNEALLLGNEEFI